MVLRKDTASGELGSTGELPKPTLETILEEALCGLSPQISAEAIVTLRSVLRELPAVLSRQIHIELPLPLNLARADLIFAIDKSGLTVLAGTNPAFSLGPALVSRPGWAEVSELCASWIAGRVPGGHLLERLWVELDLVSNTDPLATVPRIFVDLVPEAQSVDREALARLASYLLTEMARTPSQMLLSKFSDLVDEVPLGASIYSLGVALGTDRPRLRSCIRNLPARQWSTLAEQVDLSLPASEIDRWVKKLTCGEGGAGGIADLLHLELVDGGELPPIGMEVGLGRKNLEPRLYLEHLSRLGLAPQGLAETLKSWAGRELTSFSHELCPSLVDRRLNHVKIVLGADESVGSKAYLRHYHRPFPKAARRKGSFAFANQRTRTP